ncbi:hypothetical protein D3Z38_17295 [Clostridiales bacterium]|nr:hypothetical protein [Clostridiales bacterium]
MKKSFRNCVILFAVALLAAMAWGTEQVDAASQVRINSQNFPDKAIRKVARSYDKNKNGYLSPKEISKIKKVRLDKPGGEMITNYKGLERFTNLRVLHCCEAGMKSKKEITLDLSKNKKLEQLRLGYYNLENLESNVTKLKLTNCKKLKTLDVTGVSRLKTLDVKGCVALKEMSISYSKRLTTLDVSSCHKLERLLVFESKKLSQLKLGTINKLERLDLRYCPALKTLDLGKQTKLKELSVSNAPTRKLNVKNNVRLEALYLYRVPVTELNLKKQSRLKGVQIYAPKLKRLNLTGTKITKERCISEPNFYYCCIYNKNVTVVLADGEKMISPVDSYDWK